MKYLNIKIIIISIVTLFFVSCGTQRSLPSDQQSSDLSHAGLISYNYSKDGKTPASSFSFDQSSSINLVPINQNIDGNAPVTFSEKVDPICLQTNQQNQCSDLDALNLGIDKNSGIISLLPSSKLNVGTAKIIVSANNKYNQSPISLALTITINATHTGVTNIAYSQDNDKTTSTRFIFYTDPLIIINGQKVLQQLIPQFPNSEKADPGAYVEKYTSTDPNNKTLKDLGLTLDSNGNILPISTTAPLIAGISNVVIQASNQYNKPENPSASVNLEIVISPAKSKVINFNYSTDGITINNNPKFLVNNNQIKIQPLVDAPMDNTTTFTIDNLALLNSLGLTLNAQTGIISPLNPSAPQIKPTSGQQEFTITTTGNIYNFPDKLTRKITIEIDPLPQPDEEFYGNWSFNGNDPEPSSTDPNYYGKHFNHQFSINIPTSLSSPITFNLTAQFYSYGPCSSPGPERPPICSKTLNNVTEYSSNISNYSVDLDQAVLIHLNSTVTASSDYQNSNCTLTNATELDLDKTNHKVIVKDANQNILCTLNSN